MGLAQDDVVPSGTGAVGSQWSEACHFKFRQIADENITVNLPESNGLDVDEYLYGTRWPSRQLSLKEDSDIIMVLEGPVA